MYLKCNPVWNTQQDLILIPNFFFRKLFVEQLNDISILVIWHLKDSYDILWSKNYVLFDFAVHTFKCIFLVCELFKISPIKWCFLKIELLNNKLHGLLPLGGFVSPSGGFVSLLFDQAVPKNSQRHLIDWNAICILHQSDCAWLCCSLSQFIKFLVNVSFYLTKTL